MQESKPQRKKIRHARKFIWNIIISMFVAIFLNIFVLEISEVCGNSMDPKLHDGDQILIDKFFYGAFGIKRNDIIVFIPPNKDKRPYVKRVVGLPGDIFEVSRGRFFINNCEIGNLHLSFDEILIYQGKIRIIPKDKYFVLGDNLQISNDSRIFGYVSLNDIIGIAIFRLWPLSELSFL